MEIASAAIVILGLGAAAELASGAAAKGPMLRGFARFLSDTRAMRRDRDRASSLEVAGAAIAVGAGAIAGAMAAGVIDGSLNLLYLLLVALALGSNLALGTPLTRAGERRGARTRAISLAAEPAITLALVALFARWHTGDLSAIRGAHRVLGLGVQVAPPQVAVAVGIAAVALLLGAALRLPPHPGEEAGAQGGGAASAAITRWAAAGTSAVVVTGVILADRSLAGASWPLRAPHIAAALAAALLAGAFVGGLSRLGARPRLFIAGGVVLLAASAAVLALLS